MRFIYLDAGLVGEFGHHANFCRLITRECRARGIPTLVFANEKIRPKLQSELDARALFRAYTYTIYDADPIIAWLNGFETASRMTLEDLQRIHGLEPGDVVYMNWAWPAQLMALVQWVAGFPPSRLPSVFAEVGADPGLEAIGLEHGRTRVLPRDPRVDPRAILYRYAARHISRDAAHRLHLRTFDRVTSSAFQALLDRPVKTLPMPFPAPADRRRRTGARPITVSVLGHQRPEKGFGLMPEIAAALLRERPHIQILVHNAIPSQMPEVQDALRQLAARDERLILAGTMVGPALWPGLLARSDLVLCPYDPAAYVFSHSGIACESLANAIPIVVPARTALATLLDDFGGPGATFEAFTAQSIIAAIAHALDNFDRHAERAYAASEQWSRTQGPQKLLEAFLALAGAG